MEDKLRIKDSIYPLTSAACHTQSGLEIADQNWTDADLKGRGSLILEIRFVWNGLIAFHEVVEEVGAAFLIADANLPISLPVSGV